MKKSLRIIIIIWILLWVLLWLFDVDIFNIKGRVNDKNCAEEQKIESQYMNGVVIRKYKDERDIKYFDYVSKGDTIQSHWALLKGDFYSYLDVGDTINKEVGSLKFEVNKAGKDTVYIIDFECN